MSNDPVWASAYIGKADRGWYREWTTFYAAESESETIKRHMRLGRVIDEFWEQHNLAEPTNIDDHRIALRQLLEDGLRHQDSRDAD